MGEVGVKGGRVVVRGGNVEDREHTLADARPGLGNGNVLVAGITRRGGIAADDSGEGRGLKGDGAETGEQLRPEGGGCVHDYCCMAIRKKHKISKKWQKNPSTTTLFTR